MSKHVWIVELRNKKAWIPHADENHHCMYWRDKTSAEYAMSHTHNGHLKNLRITKYVMDK